MAKINFKSPAFVLTSTAILLMTVYQFSRGFSQVSLNAHLHVLTFVFIFNLVYLASSNIFSLIRFNNLSYGCYSKVIRKSFFLLSIFLFVMSFSLFLKLVLFGGFASVLDFREAFSSDEGNLSIGAGITLPFLLASMYLCKKLGHRVKYKIYATLALVIALISTTKIFILIFLFFIFYLSNIRFIHLFVYLLLALAFFSASHIIIGKFSSNPEDGIFTAVLDTLFVYFSGGFAAYQKILDGYILIPDNVMFYGLKPFEYMFSGGFLPNSGILPWIDVGVWETNVYTAFGYWFSQFGESYIFLVSSLLGVFYGFMFSRNKLASHFDFYRPFLLCCLFFTIFGDMFFPAFSMHVIYLFLAFIIGPLSNMAKEMS